MNDADEQQRFYDHSTRNVDNLPRFRPTEPPGEVRKEIRQLLFWGVDTGKASEAADAILALPAVVALLDAQAAVERVRGLLEAMQYPHLWADNVRRALDGSS